MIFCFACHLSDSRTTVCQFIYLCFSISAFLSLSFLSLRFWWCLHSIPCGTSKYHIVCPTQSHRQRIWLLNARLFNTRHSRCRSLRRYWDIHGDRFQIRGTFGRFSHIHCQRRQHRIGSHSDYRKFYWQPTKCDDSGWSALYVRCRWCWDVVARGRGLVLW